MAFTVETGTGMSDANAFITLEFFESYCADRGHSLLGSSAALKQQAIVRASDYVSRGLAWDGYPVNARNDTDGAQALAWPRYNVTDQYGYTVPSTVVPIEVQRATAEVAFAEWATPNVMAPSFTPSEVLKSAGAGPAKVEFANPIMNSESVRKVLLIVMDHLGPLLSKNSGSSIYGRAVRG